MSTTMRVHAGAAVGMATERGGGDPETRTGRGRDEGPESSPIHFTAGEVCQTNTLTSHTPQQERINSVACFTQVHVYSAAQQL